eukprot:GHVQ01024301.1.p1 GENE.GHVQ01024301.1~~GHVQ01024301.1.p1  ORF type:complete len:118 (-),score=9.92 GHVQ01024301.1:91-444(-)
MSCSLPGLNRAGCTRVAHAITARYLFHRKVLPESPRCASRHRTTPKKQSKATFKKKTIEYHTTASEKVEWQTHRSSRVTATVCFSSGSAKEAASLATDESCFECAHSHERTKAHYCI